MRMGVLADPDRLAVVGLLADVFEERALLRLVERLADQPRQSVDHPLGELSQPSALVVKVVVRRAARAVRLLDQLEQPRAELSHCLYLPGAVPQLVLEEAVDVLQRPLPRARVVRVAGDRVPQPRLVHQEVVHLAVDRGERRVHRRHVVSGHHDQQQRHRRMPQVHRTSHSSFRSIKLFPIRFRVAKLPSRSEFPISTETRSKAKKRRTNTERQCFSAVCSLLSLFLCFFLLRRAHSFHVNE